MKNSYAYGSLAPFLPLEGCTLPADLRSIYQRTAPLEVEIGFGTGEYITRIAADAPEHDFLAFEQCAKRTLKTLRKLHAARLGNVRLMRLDAVWGLRYLLPARSLAKVHCLFPCPWPKKRHAKNRLFAPPVFRLINSRLIDGASLYIVTDHKPYAAWIAANVPGTGFHLTESVIPARFGTKFEQKWADAGQREFYELVLRKTEHHDMPQGGDPMKVHFVDAADLSNIRLENTWGPLTIKFGEWLYDPKANKAMVDAVVNEDGRAQHVWIMAMPVEKGWWVRAAAGTMVLPTEGAQKAVALVAEALKASVRK